MLDESQKRTTSVSIRLSLRELNYIEQAAAERNMKVAKLLRMRALYRRLPQKIIDVSPRTYLELAYISREVDEATRLLYEAIYQGKVIFQPDGPLPQSWIEDLEAMLPSITDLLKEIDLQIVTLGLQGQADALLGDLQSDL